MKIAIFTDTFLPQVDGVVTATINLTKGLADKGHKVYIIAPKHSIKKEFSYQRVKVIRISSMPAFFYSGFRIASLFSKSLFKYLKKEKIDIIHFQTPISLGLQAIIISKLLKVPLVGTFNTLITHPQYLKHIYFSSELAEKMSWDYIKLYYNRCDLVTCPSEITKEELIKHRLKIQVKVISNCINLDEFDNSRWRELKKKYNPRGKLLLNIGRIAYEKNLFHLLRCFKLVLKRLPETKLLIVGDGPQMAEFRSKIKTLELSKNVILTGEIDNKVLKKSSIFKACDLFVTASNTETQGISTMEAQANGLVCVGIDAGGTKSLIKDGYNGYLVEEGDEKKFADKVITLLSDKSLYDLMKKNTLQEIKKYRIEDIIKTWGKEYLKLTADQP